MRTLFFRIFGIAGGLAVALAVILVAAEGTADMVRLQLEDGGHTIGG